MMTQVRKQAGSAGSRRGGATRPAASPRQAAAMPGAVDAAIDPGLFRALCDPTRAKIAVCLCKCSRACSVSEIAECCSVDLSVVSRHLAMLERAGVVEASRQGRTVLYRVRYESLVRNFRRLADAIEVCWRACGDGGACCGTGGCCGPGGGDGESVLSGATIKGKSR